MKQKLIRVYGNDTKALDEYLEKGWVIKAISAAQVELSSACYVWIEYYS